MMRRACIIGAGAYGTALAEVFASKIDIHIISRSNEVANSINAQHVNPRCLCDLKLNSNIVCSCDYSCCEDADLIFIVTPVSAVRSVCETIKNITDIPVILCSKGIELESCKLTTEIARDAGLKNELLVLSGPSFAHEIAAHKPAGVSLAGNDITLLKLIANTLSSDTFKIVPNDDLIGTQLCGAIKNVLAILCGVYMGSEQGQSAIAMLITEAMQELCELIKHAGGNPLTAYELCGVGDILLTCTNEGSRNVRFGQFLAHGGHINEWKCDLAEGSLTAKMLPQLEERFHCKLPILKKAYEMIYAHSVL